MRLNVSLFFSSRDKKIKTVARFILRLVAQTIFYNHSEKIKWDPKI